MTTTDFFHNAEEKKVSITKKACCKILWSTEKQARILHLLFGAEGMPPIDAKNAQKETSEITQTK